MMFDLGEVRGLLSLRDEFSSGLALAGINLDKFANRMNHVLEAGGILLAAEAVKKLGESIIELGVHGSEINDVREGFERLAGSTQLADQMMEAMRKGTVSTVADFKLMEIGNRALQVGAVKTADQFETLTSAARVLANQTGGDLTEKISSLSSALQTGRTRGLAMQGIVVDTAEAEKKYAASLGLSRSELSKSQRLVADRIAIFEALEGITKKAGVAQLSFAEVIHQWSTAITNWNNNLASAVAASPNVMNALKQIGDAFQKAFGGASQTMLEIIMRWVNKFADAVANYGPKIIQWVADIAAWVKKVYANVTDAWDRVPDWFKNIAEKSAMAGAAVYMTSKMVTGFNTETLGAAASVGTLVSGFESLKNILGVTWLTSVATGFYQIGVALIACNFSLEAFLLKLGMFSGTWAARGGAKLAIYFYQITRVIAEAGGVLGLFGQGLMYVGGLIVSVFTSPITLTLLAIGALVGALRLLTGSFDFITEPAKGLWQALKDIVTIAGHLWDSLKNLIPSWSTFKDLMVLIVDPTGLLHASLQAIQDIATSFDLSNIRKELLSTLAPEGGMIDNAIKGSKMWGAYLRLLAEGGGGVGSVNLPTPISLKKNPAWFIDPKVASNLYGDPTTAKPPAEEIEDPFAEAAKSYSKAGLDEKVLHLTKVLNSAGGALGMTADGINRAADEALKFVADGGKMTRTLADIVVASFSTKQGYEKFAATVHTGTKAAIDIINQFGGALSPKMVEDSIFSVAEKQVRDFGMATKKELSFAADAARIKFNAIAANASATTEDWNKAFNEMNATAKAAADEGGKFADVTATIRKNGEGLNEVLRVNAVTLNEVEVAIPLTKYERFKTLLDSVGAATGEVTGALSQLSQIMGTAFSGGIKAVSEFFGKLSAGVSITQYATKAIDVMKLANRGLSTALDETKRAAEDLKTAQAGAAIAAAAGWMVVTYIVTGYLGMLSETKRQQEEAKAAWDKWIAEATQRELDYAEKIKQAARDYGLVWADMVDPIKKLAAINEGALLLLNDFNMLAAAGYNVVAITKQMSGSMNAWLNATLKAGGQIHAEMIPIIKDLIKTGQLTEENARLMLGLGEDTMPTLADIKDAADRYGLSLDNLGPKVQQLRITDAANQIVKDFNLLTLAGVPFAELMKDVPVQVTDASGKVTTVMTGMHAQVQELVSKALKLGAELPDSMKPLIEEMVKAGKLTDEFGNVLTDTSKLNFSKPLAKMFDELIKKLDELIAKWGVLTGSTPPTLPVPGAPQPTDGTGGGGTPPAHGGNGNGGGSAAAAAASVDGNHQTATVVINLDAKTIARGIVPVFPGAVASVVGR